MTAHFYLFNVDHGQCAALRLPDERWCIFDVGRSSQFSPIDWIAYNPKPYIGQGSLFGSLSPHNLFNALSPHNQNPFSRALSSPSFFFYKATISHFHGDHINDSKKLIEHMPSYLRTVYADNGYINDCIGTSYDKLGSARNIEELIRRTSDCRRSDDNTDYGLAKIREFSLLVDTARRIGGDANTRVNNASIITRIDVYGRSILICGDMEHNAWDHVLTMSRSEWRQFVGNIDILIAPHHGHSSGFSNDLMQYAKPKIVLISARSRDSSVESRYSGELVQGLRIDGRSRKTLTTRKDGHILATISPPSTGSVGSISWQFGPDAVPLEH